MFLGLILTLIVILIGLFGIWQDKFLSHMYSRKKIRILHIVSFLIILVGISNGILVVIESYEKRKLKEERLVLTDLKIKYEIIGPLTKNTQVGHIFGSKLVLKVFNRTDSSITPFYLYSPTIWDVDKLTTNQAKVNIIFGSSPELPLIGKRIKSLEKYDAIKFPLGMIAKAMNLRKANQIIKIIEVVYVNAIEVRRFELQFDTKMTIDFEISVTAEQVWFSRPFRNVEEEYLKVILKSARVE